MQSPKPSLTPRSHASPSCPYLSFSPLHSNKQNHLPHKSPTATASLTRLKHKLQHQATLYLDQQRRKLIQEEAEKVKQQRFLSRKIEEYNANQSRHKQRLRHFEVVAEKMMAVKKSREREMVERWVRYREKQDKQREVRQEEENTMRKEQHHTPETTDMVINIIQERSRQISHHTTKHPTSLHTSKHTFSTHKIDRVQTKSIKPQPKSKPSSPDHHSERLRNLQLQQQQHTISKYLQKMHKLRDRTILRQITKQKKLRELKSKPLRILTAVRQQRLQSKRRHLETETMEKFGKFERNLENTLQVRETLVGERVREKAVHASLVVGRKEQMYRTFVNRTLEESRVGTPVRNDHLERVKSIKKRQLKINKDNVIKGFNDKMNKIAEKFHEIRIMEPEKALPESVAQQTMKITNSLVGQENFGKFFQISKKQLAMEYLESKLPNAITKKPKSPIN